MNYFKYFTNNRYTTIRKIDNVNEYFSNFTEFEYTKKNDKIQILALPKYIKNLIRKVFKFTNIDMNSDYHFKKKVPSPRGIYPYFPVINYKNYYYLYDCSTDKFIYLFKCKYTQEKIEVYFCVDLWRICSTYGNFGLILSLLELGHLLSDLKLLINSEEYINIENEEYIFKQISDDSIKNASDSLIASKISIESTKCDVCNYIFQNKYKVEKKYNNLKSLQKLGVINLINKFKSYKEPSIFETQHIFQDLEKHRNNRHSNNNNLGLFTIGPLLENDIFSSFIYKMKTYLNKTVSEVNIYIYINFVEGFKSGMYKLQNNKLKCINEQINIYSIFYDGYDRMNIDRLPFILFITYTPTNNEDVTELFKSHIISGKLMHKFSLIFSDELFFSRPVKNINDFYCGKICHIKENEYFLYTGLFGYTTNYCSYRLE